MKHYKENVCVELCNIISKDLIEHPYFVRARVDLKEEKSDN